MSKELEALAILKQTIFHYTLGCLTTEEEKAFKTIETALKRLDGIDNSVQFDVDYYEKRERAVSIIREKPVNLEYIKCCKDYEQYCLICSYGNEITQKEFDILKEVLS